MYQREAAVLLMVSSGLYLTLALASFRPDGEVDGHVGNWVGPVGATCAQALTDAFGAVAWSVPLEFMLLAIPIFRGRPSKATLARLGGDVVIVNLIAALVHVALPALMVFGGVHVGGRVGELFGELMRTLFSTVGSYIIGLTIVALILIERAAFSFIALLERLDRVTRRIGELIIGYFAIISGAWSAAREAERDASDEGAKGIDADASSHADDALMFALVDAVERPSAPPIELIETFSSARAACGNRSGRRLRRRRDGTPRRRRGERLGRRSRK